MRHGLEHALLHGHMLALERVVDERHDICGQLRYEHVNSLSLKMAGVVFSSSRVRFSIRAVYVRKESYVIPTEHVLWRVLEGKQRLQLGEDDRKLVLVETL